MRVASRSTGDRPGAALARQVRGPGRIPLVMTGAAVVLATAFASLMISLARDTYVGFNTLPAVLWCIGFAVLATAVTVVAARMLLGRWISILMTVAAAMLWSLLLLMLLLMVAVVYGWLIGWLLLIVLMPLTALACALIVLLIACICYVRPASPGNPAWFAVAGWFSALAVAAVIATVTHAGHIRSNHS